MTRKTWLEVEIEESENALRKKLEELHKIAPEDLDSEDVCCMKNVFKALWYMKQLEEDGPDRDSEE